MRIKGYLCGLLILLGSLLTACSYIPDEESSSALEGESLHTHTPVLFETVYPTCTEAGQGAGTKCADCGELLSGGAELAALGHAPEALVEISATCTTGGTAGGVYCPICSTTLEKPTLVSPTGHTPVTDPALPPTCTSEGRTAGAHCRDCHMVLLVQTALPKQEHVYTESVLTLATPHAVGEKEYVCTCGDRYTASYTMAPMTAEELYRYALPSLVAIQTYDATGAPLQNGSGFVYAADGTIMTNYHVIQKAYRIRVTFASGDMYDATQVLGYAATPDLALLKIDAEGLPVLPICEISPTVGETVYSLGSPRLMHFTIAGGIVGYADRELADTAETGNVVYVQHSAAISTGSSGGPLVNAYGEVIGINRMMMNNAQTLNFAIAPEELCRVSTDTPLTVLAFYEKEING